MVKNASEPPGEWAVDFGIGSIDNDGIDDGFDGGGGHSGSFWWKSGFFKPIRGVKSGFLTPLELSRLRVDWQKIDIWPRQ